MLYFYITFDEKTTLFSHVEDYLSEIRDRCERGLQAFLLLEKSGMKNNKSRRKSCLEANTK